MNKFEPFDDRLNGLIAALSPAARRKLAGVIAKELRKSQQQRIKQQKAPDGSPYQARKRQPLRAKTGRIKRAMFQKLRKNRYLKAKESIDLAEVYFVDKVQRIAMIHQEGLKDRPSIHSNEVKYEMRPLLGFSEDERRLINQLVIEKLTC
ncbi:TPA: phage virion morphogenesis protein [Enterobacter cloacae]|jgi:phage virion morphogenesis protein|nr:phage virion morphogenesis protein [Enterobacter cloacae]